MTFQDLYFVLYHNLLSNQTESQQNPFKQSTRQIIKNWSNKIETATWKQPSTQFLKLSDGEKSKVIKISLHSTFFFPSFSQLPNNHNKEKSSILIPISQPFWIPFIKLLRDKYRNFIQDNIKEKTNQKMAKLLPCHKTSKHIRLPTFTSYSFCQFS